MDNFYLKKIELSNYRKFSKRIFHLDSHMNVLIGSNASGKTTVLEAVCVSLGAYLAAYKKYVPSRFVFNISEWDVHRKMQRTEQRDVLISPNIAQYPCCIDSILVM